MKFTCSWTTYERNRILVAAYQPSRQGCSCKTTTVPAEPRHDLPPRSPSSTVVDGETFDDWRVSCILLFISIRICRCQTNVEVTYRSRKCPPTTKSIPDDTTLAILS